MSATFSSCSTCSASSDRHSRLPEPWRLFVAAPLPDVTATAVSEWLAPLRAAYPATRWMPPEVLHLTLVFMGQVDSGSVAAISDGLAAVASRHAPFATRTSGAGGHVDDRPGARHGGVAWLTLGAGAREMTDLALDVDETLGTHVFTAQRPPRPHLTVARNIDAPALRALTTLAQNLDLEWGTNSVVLFRSLLGPGGSRYVPLVTHALAL